jgi:hypothetical protein
MAISRSSSFTSDAEGEGARPARLQDRPRIDAWVLAELSRRRLVPAIWLPDPHVRAERERARWRLHLVRHRSSLKQRVHATLIAHGKPCPVSDLFGASGRRLLARLALSPNPGPARSRQACVSSTSSTGRSAAAR